MGKREQAVLNESGVAAPVGLLLLMVLAVLGTTCAMMTTVDLQIGQHHRTSKQAFYTAESGLEEAKARLRADAATPINDGHPDHTQWSAFIGAETKAQGKGYDKGNAMHSRLTSLQSGMDYTVRVQHQTDASGNLVYYGDADGDGVNERNTTGGQNVYFISSTGCSDGSLATIEGEASRVPPLSVPGAVYVEASTSIIGNVSIIGSDQCGAADKPGIVSRNPAGSVTVNGSPSITGLGGAEPNISYDGPDLDVQEMVDSYRDLADFSYVAVSATHTGATIPGPGDGWGSPTSGATQQDPSTCSENTIVHYDTMGTGLTLTGSAEGCGLLLIEGDLEIHGAFSWHGVILATGSIMLTGGGDKNITGALASGGSVDGDIIGGNVNIVNCTSAIADQVASLPLKVLSWREDV